MTEIIFITTIMFSFFNFAYLSANITSAFDHLIKIENASNIYVGHHHLQKIKEFHINDDIVCTDKYLPIIFKMHTENKTVETYVSGWLTEHGNVVEHQENSSNCHLYKKLDSLIQYN